jgi:hypothetical protein
MPEGQQQKKRKRFTHVKRDALPRVCQGDIFRDIAVVESVVQNQENVEVRQVLFPLVIVLTQDCDLEQDYNVRADPNSETDDKKLFSALVAPLYNAEHVRSGEHLLDLGLRMQRIPTEGAKILRSNQTPRYHYLEFSDDVPIPPATIDFKHYFSVNLEYLRTLKPTHFICRVAELYREDVSHRFASFLSRIGLP